MGFDPRSIAMNWVRCEVDRKREEEERQTEYWAKRPMAHPWKVRNQAPPSWRRAVRGPALDPVIGTRSRVEGDKRIERSKPWGVPSIRCGMASRRGQTTRRQMVKLLGKKPQVSRHRTCRRMRWSM